MAKMKTDEVITPPVAPTPGVVIYAGPTMHRRVIIGGSVYKGGLPQNIRQLVERVPEVGQMMVSIVDFASVRAATQTQGTEEHRIYNYLLALRFGENGEVK